MADAKQPTLNTGTVDTMLGKAVAGAKAAYAASGTSAKSSIDEITKNTAALNKFTGAKVKAIKTLKDASTDEARSVAVLLELDQMRLRLMQQQGIVAKQNNKELLEHYNKQMDLVRSRIAYVKQTHELDKKQLHIFKETDRLTTKQAHGKKNLSAEETAALKRNRTEISRNNEMLALRTQIEQKSIKNHKSIAAHEKEVLKTAEQKRLYKGSSSIAGKSSKSSVSTVDDDGLDEPIDRHGKQHRGRSSNDVPGKSTWMSKMVGGAGNALAAVEGLSMVRSGLVGLMHASDMATESQYQFGIGLDRVDHSMLGYAARTARTVELNTLVGISFTQMGMSAEEAQESVVKLITGSGTAMRAYQEGNVKKVQGMAEAAAAFSRQTGMEFGDVVGFQNTIIANFGRSAEQATADMNDVVGSIQGMNNKLMDAGFKGALLNMGEYSNLIKETAENTEDLALNTSDYSKRMLVAATNVRLMGATEKEASRFAAAKSKFYEGKNPFVDMQVGQKMVESLQRDYGNEIKTGNTDAIAQDLMKNKGASKNQALLVASMLTSKKPIAMMGNQMAEILRGTSISNETKDAVLDTWFKKNGITKVSEVSQVANDQLLLSQLGLDWSNPQDRLVAVDYAEDYLIKHNLAEPDPELAARLKNLGTSDDQYQKKAAAQASAGNLKTNAPPSIEKTIGAWDTFKNSPLAIPTGLAVAGYGVKHTARAAKWLVNKQARMEMSPAERAAEDAAAKAAEKAAEKAAKKSSAKAANSIAKTGIEDLATSGAEDVAKDVARTGIKDLLKSGGKAVLKGIMHNKVAALIGGSVLASTLFAKSASAGDINTTNAGIGPAPVPEYGGAENNTKDLAGNLIGNTAMHFGEKGIGKIGTKLGISGAEKLAVSGGMKFGASAAANAVPFIGGLVSSAMTYAMTEGPIGRKLSAAAGDLVGDLAGSFAGPVGGIAGGAAGQFAGTELYDWLNGEDSAGKPNTAGSVSRSGSLYSDSTSTNGVGTATQGQGSGGSRITNAAIGRFGTVRPDGSVDIELTARVQNFVPAVSQANTQSFADQTQFSGSKKG